MMLFLVSNIKLDSINDTLSYFSPCVLPHRLVDGQIAPSKHCELVMEDEIGICGFALALTDAKTTMTTSEVKDKEDTTGFHPLILALFCFHSVKIESDIGEFV